MNEKKKDDESQEENERRTHLIRTINIVTIHSSTQDHISSLLIRYFLCRLIDRRTDSEPSQKDGKKVRT